MKNRRLPIMLVALMALAFIHAPASAQPDEAPAVDTAAPVATPATPAEPAVVPDADAPVTPDAPAVDPAEEEVTPEAIGNQVKEVVSKWRTVGILAGLAALVALLIMILKLKRIDDLFARWKIKWTKVFIASGLGGIGAGITAYLVDGDLVTAIVTGAAIVGPAAIGFFEALSKFLKRNRDNGKNGDPK